MTNSLRSVPPATVSPAATTPSRWGVFTAGLVAFTTMLTMSVTSVALPAVEHDLGTTAAVSRWVLLGYVLSAVALIPFAGRLLERTGPRRALLLGAGGFAVATVLCALAPEIVTLLVARVAQGAFAAMLTVLVPVLALGSSRPGAQARALSVTAVLGSIGAFAGPAAGGGLLGPLGWRGLLLVQLPLCLVVIVAGARLPRADVPVTVTGEAPRAPGVRPLLALLALLVLAAFDGAIIILYPFFLFQGEVQLGALPEVGLTMLALPLAIVVAGLAGGRLADRRGPRGVALAGAAVAGGGTLLLLPLSPTWTAVEVALRLFVVGAGMGLYGGSAQAVLMTASPLQPVARIAARMQLVRGVGLVLGPALASTLWATSVFSRAGIGTALLPGIAAAVVAIAALVSIRSVTQQ